jgi:hypothetical protein
VGEGSGLGTIDHTEPFHDSISVSAMLDWFGSYGVNVPTAVQAEGLLHETPPRVLFWMLEVLGLGTIDHAEPFHDSISVWFSAPSTASTPTAVQAVELLHETPVNELGWLSEVLGLGTIDHTEPFHDSISVWLREPLESA